MATTLSPWSGTERTGLDVGNDRLSAARRKLLEQLYKGASATELPTDVPELPNAPAAQAPARTNATPRQVRREDEQQRPNGEQAGAFGATTFNAFAPNVAPPMGSGGGSPTSSPQARSSSPEAQALGSNRPTTGGAFATRENEMNRILANVTGAASKFMQIAVPGGRGGPPMGFQGSAWKQYQDQTGNPPADRDTGYLTPPTPEPLDPNGGWTGGAPSGPPMTGNPATGSYQSITGGGNNVSANVVRGNGLVPFGSAQTGPGSDRIAMATIGGRPVYKFTVKAGDRASNGNRAELVGSERFVEGKPYTFSWQTYIPEDFQTPQWGTFMQLHAPGSDPGNWGVHFTHADWSNPGRISLWTNGNHFTGGWSVPIQRGQWLDFQMEVTFGGNGHVRLWYNGQKVVDSAANTGGGGWYVKQGLYRGDDGRSATIYQTPLKYGASQGTGGLTNPGAGGGATPIGNAPPSGNKVPAATALTQINNTPGMWSQSFEGNRKMYRITDQLFQSGQPLPGTDAFAKAGFDLVVNMRGDQKYAGVQTLNVPINDSESVSSSELNAARNVAKQVAAAIRAGKRVLVHCYAGANRSGLVNALTLIELGYSPTQALQMVRAGRPGAVSNKAFERYILTGSV